jgi:hypothetical protein
VESFPRITKARVSARQKRAWIRFRDIREIPRSLTL